VIYPLDTTAFSALMRRVLNVRARIENLSSNDRVLICAITRGEILYGLTRLAQGKRRQDLEAEATALFNELECVAVPETAADHYANVKSAAEKQGTPLDENDLWIAATALSLSAVLVITDTDFQRVSTLKLEDWM
jgi:predicted nucleic acid-binding protein